MPTYEYKCEECGAHFDVVQKMTDAPLEHCIKCNGKVRRLISGGAGIIFKGSGFYCTDYRKSSGCGCQDHAHEGGHCCESGHCCHSK